MLVVPLGRVVLAGGVPLAEDGRHVAERRLLDRADLPDFQDAQFVVLGDASQSTRKLVGARRRLYPITGRTRRDTPSPGPGTTPRGAHESRNARPCRSSPGP